MAVKNNVYNRFGCNFFVSGPLPECFGGRVDRHRPVSWRVRCAGSAPHAPAIDIFLFGARSENVDFCTQEKGALG